MRDGRTPLPLLRADSPVQQEHTGAKPPAGSTNGTAGAQKPPPGQQGPSVGAAPAAQHEEESSDPLLTEDEVLEARRARAVLAAVMLLMERPCVSEDELSRLAAPMTVRVRACVATSCEVVLSAASVLGKEHDTA